MDRDLFMFYKAALEGKFATPLCSEYKSAWRKCGDDKEMLVRLVMKQQSIPYFFTACYKHLGLTKEYIIENFGEYINGKRTFSDVEGVNGYTYQLYVGYDKDFKITADVTSLMWCDGSQIVIPQTKCSTLYISNSSDVHISCDGFNSPRIYLFDDSCVTIDDSDENTDIIVYKYDSRAIVDVGKFCLGKVKVFNKELRL